MISLKRFNFMRMDYKTQPTLPELVGEYDKNPNNIRILVEMAAKYTRYGEVKKEHAKGTGAVLSHAVFSLLAATEGTDRGLMLEWFFKTPRWRAEHAHELEKLRAAAHTPPREEQRSDEARLRELKNKKRREARRKKWQELSEEERERHRADARERQRRYMRNMTPERRAEHRKHESVLRKKRLAKLSPEQRAARREMAGAAARRYREKIKQQREATDSSTQAKGAGKE